MTQLRHVCDKKAGHGAGAGGGSGVLLARVPRRLCRARVLAQPGLAAERRAVPRRGRLLHEPRFGHGSGARRGGRRRFRRLQSRGGGARGRVRLEQGRCGHHLRGAHEGCGRATGARAGSGARRTGGRHRVDGEGGGAAAPRGQAALRRAAEPRACRAIRWATCGGWRTCSANTAATPTRRPGPRPASTPPRSGCSPSSTGGCPCAPTSARGPGRTSSSSAAEARLSARGLVADGAFTAEGRALREEVEVATDAQCAVILDALGDSVRCAAGHPHPVGRRAPRRRCVPPAGPARPGPGSLTLSRAVGARCPRRA